MKPLCPKDLAKVQAALTLLDKIAKANDPGSEVGQARDLARRIRAFLAMIGNPTA